MKNSIEKQNAKRNAETQIPSERVETAGINMRYQMRKMTERFRNNHRVIF